MSNDDSSGINFTKYQARIKTDTAGTKIGGTATSYGSLGWFNTDCTRTVGWHHSRIVVGPASGGANTVAFYIDDMSTARLIGSATGTNYNGLEFNARLNTPLIRVTTARADV